MAIFVWPFLPIEVGQLFKKYSRQSTRQNKQVGSYQPKPLSDSAMRVFAINLLSRREYSLHELSQKLEPRSQNTDQVPAILDKLVAAGYQSDQRFAESFLRSRISRGLGPMRIERELKDKGIDSYLREQVFATDFDWFQQAYEFGLKKSQSLNLTDYKEKQKLYRYLAYRGFSMDQIHYAAEQYLEKTDV